MNSKKTPADMPAPIVEVVPPWHLRNNQPVKQTIAMKPRARRRGFFGLPTMLKPKRHLPKSSQALQLDRTGRSRFTNRGKNKKR